MLEVKSHVGGRARVPPSLITHVPATQNLDAACPNGLASAWEAYADTDHPYQSDLVAAQDFGSTISWCGGQLVGPKASLGLVDPSNSSGWLQDDAGTILDRPPPQSSDTVQSEDSESAFAKEAGDHSAHSDN